MPYMPPPLRGPQVDTSNWLRAYQQGQAQRQPQSGTIIDPSGEGWQTTWQREPQRNWLQEILMGLFGGGSQQPMNTPDFWRPRR